MPKIIGDPTVRFNLFDRKAIEPTYVILYYQYRKGKRLKYSTGRKISPLYWDVKKQRATYDPDPDAAEFNRSIEELNSHLATLKKHCEEIYKSNPRILPDTFRDDLNRILYGDREEEAAVDTLTFLQFVEQIYRDRERQPNIKKGSLQVLHKVLLHLQNYSRDRRRKLEFSELGERFYNDFRDWLHSPPRSLNTNYVRKIFQNLKFFIRKAENRHLHNDRSYREFFLPSAPVTKLALTFEQLEHLETLDFSATPHLEVARDLFLIGAYSGQRYGDFSSFKPEHVKEYDGQRVIELVTEKTKQAVIIPLHPTLDKMLSKYGYKSPPMANQRMNKYLKEIGKAAGMTGEIIRTSSKGGVSKEAKTPMYKLLATHCARRSFATNYYKRHPHLINEIMGITGHTTERMFRSYIVSDKLEGAMTFAKGIKSN